MCILKPEQQNEEEGIIVTQNKSGRVSFWKERELQWDFISEIKIDFFGFCKMFLFQDILYTPLRGCKCLLISIDSKEKLKIIELTDKNTVGEVMTIKVVKMVDKTYIFVTYECQKLILWLADTVEKVSSLQLEECPMAFDFDLKTKKGLCGYPSNKIQVFYLSSNLEIKLGNPIALINPGVASILIRPDSKLVAVGCWDGKLKLYSFKKYTLLAVLDVHSSSVTDISFYEKVKNEKKPKFFLAAGSQDSKISVWDLYN